MSLLGKLIITTLGTAILALPVTVKQSHGMPDRDELLASFPDQAKPCRLSIGFNDAQAAKPLEVCGTGAANCRCEQARFHFCTSGIGEVENFECQCAAEQRTRQKATATARQASLSASFDAFGL